MQPLEIDRRELKRIAREAMKLARPGFPVVTLVYILMTTGLVTLSNFIPSVGGDLLPLFLTVLLTMYTTVVDFGYMLWSLWTFRRMDPDLNALMQGFSVAGRVLLLRLSVFMRTVGWVIVLYFAAIVPLAFLLPAFLPADGTLNMAALSLLMIPILLFFYAAVWVIMLRYTLAPYLLADRPDDGFGAAIQRSVELMRGWKWELFKLEFSFLGWELLGLAITAVVTLAFLIPGGFFAQIPGGDLNALQASLYAVLDGSVYILVSNLALIPLQLWLHPYREVTRAGFYDARLRLHHAGSPTPPPL